MPRNWIFNEYISWSRTWCIFCIWFFIDRTKMQGKEKKCWEGYKCCNCFGGEGGRHRTIKNNRKTKNNFSYETKILWKEVEFPFANVWVPVYQRVYMQKLGVNLSSSEVFLQQWNKKGKDRFGPSSTCKRQQIIEKNSVFFRDEEIQSQNIALYKTIF